MIRISSPLRQEEIIELLNEYSGDNLSFTFKKKNGIALFFDTDASNVEKSAKLAKALIKEQSWGSILSFQSIAV